LLGQPEVYCLFTLTVALADYP